MRAQGQERPLLSQRSVNQVLNLLDLVLNFLAEFHGR